MKSFILSLLILFPSLVSAVCAGGPPRRLSLIEVHACESVDGYTDLLIEGKQLEYFILDKPLAAEGGTDKLEEWVYLNTESATCDDLLRASFYAVLSATCCDVLPSKLLDCQRGIPVLKTFQPSTDKDIVDLSFLHQVGRRTHLIGADKPFTGTGVKYSRSHLDGTTTPSSEFVYESGRFVKTISRDESGVIRGEHFRRLDGVEITKSFNHLGQLIYERTTYHRSANTNWQPPKEGFVNEWDAEGNLLRCYYTRSKEACE